MVPLVQHLSNADFGRMVENLSRRSTDAVREGSPAYTVARVCACECGDLVNAPRKFVNQEHYNVWMRRRPYWGRNQSRRA